MNNKAMNIAFDAARMIEGEAAMGLWAGDCFIDPDVDTQGNPYVSVSVEASLHPQICIKIPESVKIGGCVVPIVVKPLDMRMN